MDVEWLLLFVETIVFGCHWFVEIEKNENDNDNDNEIGDNETISNICEFSVESFITVHLFDFVIFALYIHYT